jgi:two-component system chemotaxis response regulator CheB
MTWSLQGRLQDFNLPQVVALLEAMQSSGRLNVLTSSLEGALIFQQGQVIDAETGGRIGELAAHLILASEEGEFRFQKEQLGRPAVIGRSNQALCMETMRLVDESRDHSAHFSLATLARETRHTARVAEDGQILEAIGGRKATVREISEWCSLHRIEVLFRLEALIKAGVVSRTNGRSPRSASSGRKNPDAVRVLVVDDSRLMRRNLTRLFESAPGLEVVGAAASGREALDMIPDVRPDVISLDLHMPELDGVATLKRIMLSDPIPTVILSAANPEELDRTFDAILRFGAVDFVTKPSKMRGAIDVQGQSIVERVRTAAGVNLRGIRLFQPRLLKRSLQALPRPCSGLVTAIAGTGACLPLMQLLSHLPADLPFGLLCVTSMSDEFLNAFIAYMGRYSPFQLKVVKDGDRVMAGVGYLVTREAPVRIVDRPSGPTFVFETGAGPTDPNLLMYDTARHFGATGVGLLMSNQAEDLESGLGELTKSGGLTLAQLPETCIDATGPQMAVDQGLIQRTVVLNRLASELSQTLALRTHRSDGGSPRDGGKDPWQTISC